MPLRLREEVQDLPRPLARWRRTRHYRGLLCRPGARPPLISCGVLQSPSLVGGAEAIGTVAIDEGSIDSAALEAFIAERPGHRVGRYFETLVHFWLKHVRKVEMVGAGVQIRDGKRTLGEIDFLFRDEEGRLNHCEAAVKFFLHHPSDSGSHFPGPNASDNFELKTDRLFGHQLHISEEHYPEVEVRMAFVRGQIFYKAGIDAPTSLPARMAPDHLRGTWLRESELANLDVYEDAVGRIADKPHWLAPVIGALRLPMPELTSQLSAHFARSDHPVMVDIMTSDAGLEIQRLFVTSDLWPNRPDV